MKKFLNISLLSLVALSSLMLSSCKNEIDEIFDEDAIARLDNKKAEYIDILTDKGGKWQMEYYNNIITINAQIKNHTILAISTIRSVAFVTKSFSCAI